MAAWSGSCTGRLARDPAELVDGDRYRLTALGWRNEQLVRLDRVFEHAESYPDGPECDAYPRKLAHLGAP